MTPEPPTPTLPQLSVDTSKAMGVIYLGDYTSGAYPDLQRYNGFSVDSQAYTLTKSGTAYLVIDRSADVGDTVNIGFAMTTARVVYYNGHCWNFNSSGQITLDNGADSSKPTLSPENAELLALINNPDGFVELSEVIR